MDRDNYCIMIDLMKLGSQLVLVISLHNNI